ncbi:cytochrome c biogenesis protein ResB [Streptomyces sulphureus]|uniref:cytochrome c biogenesis protein ResB n=1 Tax=Streptomyces sulphureus TaxID=47758 RepID=UPI0003688245|nr:cytochrome c biogenesis protein ResB [Streptomyces sulphureus]
MSTTGSTDQRSGQDEAADQEAATSQLSTAPSEERLNVPSLGPIGWLRWVWRHLTSMRFALILLFLLSLAAIPGSVIPQTDVDAIAVDRFKDDHTTLAPLYEKLQLFDVYTSVWFSAIYILLFISLAGCIVPRTWQFVGQLRGRPPRAPRKLDRMPVYTTWQTEAEADHVLATARTLLGKKRFRVHTAEGTDSVASEKGYLREAGNLLFHISLIVLLLAFGAGQLFKSEGGKLVVMGEGFSNTLTQYDDFSSGSLFTAQDLDTFGFTLKDFRAEYEMTGPQKGSARDYQADISYWEGAEGKPKDATVKVNEPLRVGESKVYLQAHGYAPKVTVRDGQGDVAYAGPVPFLQQDNNLTSSGVVKVPDYRDAEGRKDQLGFQGFFVPDFAPNSGTMFSQSPTLKNPQMFLTAYHGNLGVDGGPAQNVYRLDTSNLKQFKNDDGDALAERLQPGDTMKLPDGAGSLEFEGIEQWANFTVSHQVGNGWALAGSLLAIGGLAGSLFIQRRRVWVRAKKGRDGRTVVEMAGLGRSESTRLPEELAGLAASLYAEAPRPRADGQEAADRTAEPGRDAAAEPQQDEPHGEARPDDVPGARAEQAGDGGDSAPGEPRDGRARPEASGQQTEGERE